MIKFNFNWTPADLDIVDENIKSLARKIAELGIVSVDEHLNEKGQVITRHPGLCRKAGVINHLASGIVEGGLFNCYYSIPPKGKMNYVCAGRNDANVNRGCKFNSCPIPVAGYYWYLANREISDNEEVVTEVVEDSTYDKVMKRQEQLRGICCNDDMYATFLPLTADSVKGVRCCFIGDEGTDKETYIGRISSWLFACEKTISKNYQRRSMDALPEKFEENCLYVIDGLEACNEIIEDDGSLSERAQNQQKDMKKALKKLVTAPKTRYIVLDATPIAIKKFFAVNSKLPYIFEQKVNFENWGMDEILKVFEEELPDEISVNNNDRISLRDYLRNNIRYFPFKNRELASFLAGYVLRRGRFELPPERYTNKNLNDMLSSIIGMDNVKQQLAELEKYLSFRQNAKELGITLPDFNMHMMFLGNPGTGKTTIARIIAQILFDLGYIAENKCIEVTEKDLTGGYIGQSAIKTGKVIQRALGGVLFVDEAYSLADEHGYGAQAIATLIKAMEDYKGDLVVIFAGYSKEMSEFINMNSGIASRIGYTMEFADYSSEELYQMFELKAKKTGMEVLPETKAIVMELMGFGRNRKNFGNGRFVDTLFQKTLVKHAVNAHDTVISKADIPSVDDILAQASGEREPDKIQENFEDIIGLQNIKDKVKELAAYVKFRTKAAQLAAKALPSMNLHMLFTGEAGTGKTTMARRITKMLYDLGAIRVNKCVEVDRKDLVATHIGQTAPKVDNVIQSALGGVLFIDEAYSLTPKGEFDYGHEAIATLIKAMEDQKGELVVIFAGYTKEMKEFVNANSGIASRIGYTFEFESYSDEELYQILEVKTTAYSFEISEAAQEKIKEIIRYFSSVENFGNGRFIDKLFQEITVKHAQNCTDDANVFVLQEQDIPTIKEMVEVTFSNEENLVLPADVSDEERRITAIHELGHAVGCYILTKEANIKVITVIPEGTGSLGYVLHEKPKGKIHKYKKDYLSDIMISLAGRAAEEIYIGEAATGCWKDLERATEIARRAIHTVGFGDTLGLTSANNRTLDGYTQAEVNKEMKKILADCYENTKTVLMENKPMFDKVLDYLMTKGTITGEEFLKLVE